MDATFLLFLPGFVLQGEPALLLWYAYYARQPLAQLSIFLISLLLTFSTGILLFYLGHLAHTFRWLNTRLLSIISRFSLSETIRPSSKFLLTIHFLYGIRHPLLILLGWTGFPGKKFVVWNLLASLLWACTWWLIFFLIKAPAETILMRYRTIIFQIYLIVLALGTLKVILNQIKHKKSVSKP